MKIGFLGSAFDPISTGHMVTIQEVMEQLGFDRIMLMPSSSKRSDKAMHITDEHRLKMIELAIEGNDKLGIETIEMSVPHWEVYTYQTMRKLKEKYPHDELYFLMGADLLEAIADNKWVHTEEFLSENQIVVVRRNNLDMDEIVSKSRVLRKNRRNLTFVYKQIDNNVSSSVIREAFEDGFNPRYYMDKDVYRYIEQNQLYRPEKKGTEENE